jgi:uncharacterized OsmC-like protein
MAAPAERPQPMAELEQVARYEFVVRFPGTSFPPIEVDESAPVGADRGPNPARTLAVAVGHCMNATLFNTLERSHVAVHPISSRVWVEVGRNAKGRQRVLALEVQIETAPLREEDRERFDHCVAIFEDFCTVSGAVREGIRIVSQVRPAANRPPSA